MKKILIVAYVFPPSYAIGGRRWAYFAKYLNRIGYEVFVLTSDQVIDENKQCPWLDAIKDLKQDNIIRISAKFPYHVENNNPKSILEKIKYRLSLRKTKQLFTEDSVYERYTYFSEEVYTISNQLIEKHNIQNVIVTGDPFHLAYRISQLKRNYADRIRLIVDLRDPWTIKGKFNEGENKVFLETSKQPKTIDFSDVTFVPNEGMKKNLDELFPMYSDKVKVLPHGFDTDVFITKKIKGNFDKWYYAGTIFPSLVNEYSILDQLIKSLNVTVNFYSFSEKGRHQVMSNPNVNEVGLISQNELINVTEDCGITLYLPLYKDAFSSKFYELIQRGIFILYIGDRGKISKFINSNKIGYAIEVDKIDDLNDEIIKLKKAFDDFEEKSYLAKNYSFFELSKIIIKELI